MVDFQSRFDDTHLGDLTLSEVIANRARSIGNRVFIYYGNHDRELTYDELDSATNSIGNSLVAKGFTHQKKIAVMLRDPLQTVLAMYGINKAGNIFSPINYNYNGSVLAYQLNDLDPDALIIEDQYISRLDAIRDDLTSSFPVIVYRADTSRYDAHEVSADATYSALLAGSQAPVPNDVAWYDTASILYTSGTTGNPKGVVLPYRWIFYYTVLRQVLLDEDDVIHVPKPLYHVGAAYWSVTSALIAGASVSLWDKFSVSQFWDRIDRYNATTATLVSVMVSWLMDTEETARDAHNTLSKVQLVPLPKNYDDLSRRFGFEIVTSAYAQSESGMTLCGIIHTEDALDEYYRGKRMDTIRADADRLGVPIVKTAPDDRWVGRPMSFVETGIVDEHDEPLGAHQTGELVLRPTVPSTVFKEYYSDPDKTVRSFRNLWFHTGDALYYDDDHNYYFVDRMGDLIRRRGENISSSQIEDVFASHDSIVEAVVFSVPSDADDEDAIAIAIQSANGAQIMTADLERYAADNLPAFMTPDHYYFVDEIPTTETNKIMKHELRDEFL